MKSMSGSTLLLIIIVILAVIFLVYGCTLKCKSIKEGYRRSCLGNECNGLQRSPVDYAFKNPNGWQRNPHWQSCPSIEYQPLDYGPIDFYYDSRRLDKNNGVLFQQYRNDWEGRNGVDTKYMANDSKNRFDLTTAGSQGGRNLLDSVYTPRFGPYGNGPHTERSYDEPNPYFDKIYGGRHYLAPGFKIGA